MCRHYRCQAWCLCSFPCQATLQQFDDNTRPATSGPGATLSFHWAGTLEEPFAVNSHPDLPDIVEASWRDSQIPADVAVQAVVREDMSFELIITNVVNDTVIRNWRSTISKHAPGVRWDPWGLDSSLVRLTWNYFNAYIPSECIDQFTVYAIMIRSDLWLELLWGNADTSLIIQEEKW